jgi:membrane associated rhomboid family serine protease
LRGGAFLRALPPVVLLIVLANVLIFVAMAVVTAEWTEFSERTLIAWGAEYVPLLQSGEYWRLITATFVHLNLVHLMLNMSALYAVGVELEPRYGSKRFALIYLVSAVAGTALSAVALWETPVISAGASGAILGCIGAAAVASHRAGAAARRLRNGMVGWAALILVLGLTGLLGAVDNAAHLGGLGAGALVARLSWGPKPDNADLKSTKPALVGRYCGHCGGPRRDAGDLYCRWCGEPLYDRVTCAGCGIPTAVGSRFCGHCGARLGSPDGSGRPA